MKKEKKKKVGDEVEQNNKVFISVSNGFLVINTFFPPIRWEPKIATWKPKVPKTKLQKRKIVSICVSSVVTNNRQSISPTQYTSFSERMNKEERKMLKFAAENEHKYKRKERKWNQTSSSRTEVGESAEASSFTSLPGTIF